MVARWFYRSLALTVVTLSAFGQTAVAPSPGSAPVPAPDAAKVEMPSDPAALLELSAKKNGLQNAGLAPWHLKATYDVLRDQGEVKETGVFEKWWVSERKYKLTYTSPSFSQTDYSTEAGLFRAGIPAWPSEQASVVQGSFFPSFPMSHKDQSLKVTSKLKLEERIIGGVGLKCVIEEPKGSIIVFNPVTCFSADMPVLRIGISEAGLYETFYNEIIRFRGSYLAKNVRVVRLGKPFVNVRLQILESMTTVDEAIFNAPESAVKVSRRVSLDSSVTAPRLIHNVQPMYPAEAKRKGVQGTVLLHAIIDADGTLREIVPLAGPELLIAPSLESVRQWLYSPYEVNGEPVDVKTFIRVVFKLGA